MMHLIAGKLLRLRIGEGHAGQESSLAGNDLLRLDGQFRITPTVGASVTSILGALITLMMTLGADGLIGLVVMLIVLVASSCIAQCGKAAQIGMLRAADRRVGVMRELMEGTKVVKMQVWEEVHRARRRRTSSRPASAAVAPPRAPQSNASALGRLLAPYLLTPPTCPPPTPPTLAPRVHRPISSASLSRVLRSCATSDASESSPSRPRRSVVAHQCSLPHSLSSSTRCTRHCARM